MNSSEASDNQVMGITMYNTSNDVTSVFNSSSCELVILEYQIYAEHNHEECLHAFLASFTALESLSPVYI